MKPNKWVITGIGIVLGLTLGVVVSLVADVPFAPEIGALMGGFIGYVAGVFLARRAGTST